MNDAPAVSGTQSRTWPPQRSTDEVERELEKLYTAGFPRIKIEDLLSGNTNEDRAYDLYCTMILANEHCHLLKLVFRYYLSHGFYNAERRYFAMNYTQFRCFARDCKCSPKTLTDAGTIFKLCNREEVRDDENPDLEMLIFEFLLGVIRLSQSEYGTRIRTLRDQLDAFLSRNVVPHAKVFAADNFRSVLLSSEPVQQVFKQVHDALMHVYVHTSKLDTTAGKLQTMNIREFFVMLRDTELIDACVTIVRASHIFMMANFEDEDNGWNDWDWEASFEEFQDALVRIFLTRVGKGNMMSGIDRAGKRFAQMLQEFLMMVFFPACKAAGYFGDTIQWQKLCASELRSLRPPSTPQLGSKSPSRSPRRAVSLGPLAANASASPSKAMSTRHGSSRKQ
jgi:hypothetical protein